MAVELEKRIIAAILVFAIAIPVILFMEPRNIRKQKSYDELGVQIIELPSSGSLDASMEGKFVCVSGILTSPEDYVDPEFGYTFPVVKLSRDVEYWQIVEDKIEKTVKDDQGYNVTRTSYAYESKWTRNPVTSAFHDEPNMNSVLLTLDSKSYVAQKLTLGSYPVAGSLIAPLQNSPLRLPAQSAEKTVEASEKLMEFFFDIGSEDYFHQSDNMYYFGLDPTEPSNGDVRVKFSGYRKDQKVSVIAQVSNGILTKGYIDGTEVTTVKQGEHSLRNMRGKVEHKESFTTWGTRFAFWLLLSCGFVLLFDGKKRHLLKGCCAGTVLFMLLVFYPWIRYKWYMGALALLVAALASVYLFVLFRKKTPKDIDDKNPEIVDISGNAGSKKPNNSGNSGKPGKTGNSSNSGKSGTDPSSLPEDVGDEIQTFDL